MGTRGPAPKRPDKRHGHRSKAELARIRQVSGAAAAPPPLGMDVHPLAADWYAALSQGAEAAFYTPAMWQRARITAHMLDIVVTSGKPSSMMYAAIQSDMKALLVDAAELRRLGIDVRPPAPPGGDVIDWRARVGGD